MLNQYIETALWSSVAYNDNGEDRPMDENYSSEDLADETLEAMQKDCEEFKQLAGDLLDGLEESDIGHDFWLTRCGHGAGFWDGDYEEELGEKLTEISNTFGEVDLYVGDDGKIYQS